MKLAVLATSLYLFTAVSAVVVHRDPESHDGASVAQTKQTPQLDHSAGTGKNHPNTNSGGHDGDDDAASQSEDSSLDTTSSGSTGTGAVALFQQFMVSVGDLFGVGSLSPTTTSEEVLGAAKSLKKHLGMCQQRIQIIKRVHQIALINVTLAEDALKIEQSSVASESQSLTQHMLDLQAELEFAIQVKDVSYTTLNSQVVDSTRGEQALANIMQNLSEMMAEDQDGLTKARLEIEEEFDPNDYTDILKHVNSELNSYQKKANEEREALQDLKSQNPKESHDSESDFSTLSLDTILLDDIEVGREIQDIAAKTVELQTLLKHSDAAAYFLQEFFLVAKNM
ncbi:hypothetical protein BSLG_003111 [Batrachochytrium salamandrivorans]|nr:hypothetical protein BASA62_000023 [Batrachochytrium salamandrivorans]KAH6560307.1 hypothetical protein BASA60_000020 [Batrachochytrium salamandrivorans]KAH9264867.1 hypothetical protein BASA83_011614 [Batrachochytrium salamandrivorans]KAJ1342352.1 hypothetical protein BSLG_003111 [Batrachochytrium salamandrivorans]